MMKILAVALPLFLLMDAIGNIPLYISFLKNVDVKRQRWIIFRELVIALCVIILFNFLGRGLMDFLRIQDGTIQIAGGILLFLLCLKMIFPPLHDPAEELIHDNEPFIVPLAVPLVAGPAVLAAVMIYSKEFDSLTMVGAILIAWIASLIILLSASLLKSLLGWKGLLALERLMGVILLLIAVQMFMSGLGSFLQQHSFP